MGERVEGEGIQGATKGGFYYRAPDRPSSVRLSVRREQRLYSLRWVCLVCKSCFCSWTALTFCVLLLLFLITCSETPCQFVLLTTGPENRWENWFYRWREIILQNNFMSSVKSVFTSVFCFTSLHRDNMQQTFVLHQFICCVLIEHIC